MFALKALSTTFLSAIFALAAMTMPALADASHAQKSATQNEADKKTPDAQAAKSGADGNAQEGEERDYYTRRAQKMLKEDAAVDAKQHPLAANYPDQFVVVCEGGCKNLKAHIVDFEPRNRQTITEIGEMIPTASGGSDAQPATSIVHCVAGCTRQDENGFDLSSSAGVWDSTGDAPTPHRSGESGRWLTQ